MTLCCDFYNQTAHDEIVFTLRAAMEHGGNDVIPCILPVAEKAMLTPMTTPTTTTTTGKSDDEGHDGLL